MKIPSHDANSEWRLNGERNCSPLVTEQMESSLAIFGNFADMAPKNGECVHGAQSPCAELQAACAPFFLFID